MKKSLFFVAAASALMLTACSSENDVVQNAPQSQETTAKALDFDVYLPQAANVTRAGDPAGVMTTEKLKTAGKGFGVMAFYQADDATYASSLAPNFMYNEHVTWNGGWSYSPLKYWPNETTKDSQDPYASTGTPNNDYLSFFAYAPYVSTGTGNTLGTKADNYMVKTYSGSPLAPATYYTEAWKGGETSGILSASAEDHTGDPLVEWGYTTNLDNNVDLLWGVAPAGFSYTNVSGTTTSVPVGMPLKDLVKPDKDQKVKFLFQHALSRIGLSVVSAIDQVAAGDDGNKFTNDPTTKVLIKEVKVYGDFGKKGVLNLNNTVANEANWETASILKSAVGGEALFTFTGAPTDFTPSVATNNYYLSPDLRYVESQITAVGTSAANFAAVNAGVLPSEKTLLSGDADLTKAVTDPSFAYGKVYYKEAAVGDKGCVIAEATAENANGFTYNSTSDVYTQVQKTGGTLVKLNGYSAHHYKITATTASGTSADGVKYYTKSGDESTGDAVYTYKATGDGTSAIPASCYTLATSDLGVSTDYDSGTYYTALIPRYFMVIPTGSTNIKVNIKYAVVTKDEKLTGNVSNVENDITKTVTVDLKNGKSYNLKLILGLTSVKLDATVADWQVADDTEIFLPKNE